MIYEGTNGVQSLDLLSRKVTFQNGVAYTNLQKLINATIDEAVKDHSELLSPYAKIVKEAIDRHLATTTTMLKSAKSEGLESILANSHEYLNFTGHTVIGWMWLKQGIAASKGLKKPDLTPADEAFYRGKIATLEYFCCQELPKTKSQAEILCANPQINNTMKNAWF
jgi:butyryl-CoA dehydrogenase